MIHTACPFLLDVGANHDDKSEVNQRIKQYQIASKLLAKSACRYDVRKVVMTGAATSVIGPKPNQEGTYYDSNEWADIKEVTRPNERGKFLAERSCWDEILRH